jgi:SAM-dependent methyltransferase
MTADMPQVGSGLPAAPPPRPWEDGLPWHEPEFSKRMLAEHLTQDHDLASRRSEIIDAQVAWLHAAVLAERPGRILDLGSGAGLHTLRLAALGHGSVGIDVAPAAVSYARNEAAAEGADCVYRLEDVRTADLGRAEYDLVIMLYGDIDTIAPAEAEDLVRRAAVALRGGGSLVLEVHTRQTLEEHGNRDPIRRHSEGGLMEPAAHLLVEESHWLEDSATAVVRLRVITDDGERAVTVTTQYRDYTPWLQEAGLTSIAIHPGYGPCIDPRFRVIAARAPLLRSRGRTA